MKRFTFAVLVLVMTTACFATDFIKSGDSFYKTINGITYESSNTFIKIPVFMYNRKAETSVMLLMLNGLEEGSKEVSDKYLVECYETAFFSRTPARNMTIAVSYKKNREGWTEEFTVFDGHSFRTFKVSEFEKAVQESRKQKSALTGEK